MIPLEKNLDKSFLEKNNSGDDDTANSNFSSDILSNSALDSSVSRNSTLCNGNLDNNSSRNTTYCNFASCNSTSCNSAADKPLFSSNDLGGNPLNNKPAKDNKSLNDTPQGERLHIGIFGKRNAGKSSLLNAITGQSMAVVSDIKGTTTDPVSKAMEIPPIGAVMITDTAGIDDSGTLGSLRIEKTFAILRKTDIALLVVDACEGLGSEDNALIKTFGELGIKYLIVYNKIDLIDSLPLGNADSAKKDVETNSILTQSKAACSCSGKERDDLDNGAKACHIDTDAKTKKTPSTEINANANANAFFVSTKDGKNIFQLKERIAELCRGSENSRRLVADLIIAGDVVVLVTPIDRSAPKGRLILPQQQAIRDILESGGIAIVTKDSEFSASLAKLKNPPALVITDSQVFSKIAAETPGDVRLTSFSILMARYKGVLDGAAEGAKALDTIKDDDKILISEGCTHHRQCEDIGTVKLPRWIEKHTGAKPHFEFSSGGDFPADLSRFKLVVHCGGCMLNNREMLYRLRKVGAANVPMTNYGIAISHMQGILPRCLSAMNTKN